MRATVKTVRISTRKVRFIADAIRNMNFSKAIATLALLNKRGSGVLRKALESAKANAMQKNANITDNKLLIEKLIVNEGPFLKRFHASTRGRTKPYKKRSSHITVVLKEENGQES